VHSTWKPNLTLLHSITLVIYRKDCNVSSSVTTADSHHFVTTIRCVCSVPTDSSAVATKPTSTKPSRESSHLERRDATSSCSYGKRRLPQRPHVPPTSSFRICYFQNQQLLRPSEWREVLVRDRLCLANVTVRLLLCPTWPVVSPFINIQLNISK